MLDIKAHLRSLVEAHGPSGHEGPVREIVREAWSDLVDDFDVDGLGSLIGVKRATHPIEGGEARKIMLAAHMDEIGMMVRDVVDGFVFVHRISGVDNRVMLSQTVMVHGRKPLSGIVAAKPPHMLDAASRKKYPTFDELVIDVGLHPDEVAELVQPGDLITVDVPMIDLNGGKVAAKAMDDRACVAIVTACLDLLQGMNHSWDVYATATVQEETGLFGAATAAYRIQPDVAIALEGTTAHDLPDPNADPDQNLDVNPTCKVGDGPALTVMDASMIAHPKLLKFVQKTATDNNIPYQFKTSRGGGTDAGGIHITDGGIPATVISMPCRYIHSPAALMSREDYASGLKLIQAVLQSITFDDFSAY